MTRHASTPQPGNRQADPNKRQPPLKRQLQTPQKHAIHGLRQSCAANKQLFHGSSVVDGILGVVFATGAFFGLLRAWGRTGRPVWLLVRILTCASQQLQHAMRRALPPQWFKWNLHINVVIHRPCLSLSSSEVQKNRRSEEGRDERGSATSDVHSSSSTCIRCMPCVDDMHVRLGCLCARE